MGCIVNGPGESKHADIGISLPGTGETPAAPVFIDGAKAMTLRGEGIAREFKSIVEDYIERRFGLKGAGGGVRMYEPPLHRQEDLAEIHALIRAAAVRACWSATARAGCWRTRFRSRSSTTASGFGHAARPCRARQSAMARSGGGVRRRWSCSRAPSSYITPSWYATKRETGKVVPTWNYVMVQARGEPSAFEAADWLRAQVEQLTREREAGRAAPWAVGDAPEDFIASQLRAIVGIEIPISDLRGKWKASQNRNDADREGVIAGLGDDPMAEIVRGVWGST